MKTFQRGLLVCLTAMWISLLVDANAHNIKRRNTQSEQDRIRSYQIRIQNYIAARESGGEMSQRTEPLQCYSCLNARTNEECNRGGMVTCLPTQTSCQTEIRVFNPKNRVNVRIKKGCKQERACMNNFLQNDKQAWPSTQCNYIPRTLLSVCRYCCTEPGCNQALPDHVCGKVPVPEHGAVRCRKNHLQSSICTFTCDPCHSLSGSRVRMCLDSAMWSGTETKCTYDEALPGCAATTSCPADIVRPPANGNVECSNGNELGSQCRFICERGYFLNGKRVLRCDENAKEWDAERPICVRGDDGSNPCHVYAVFEFATDGQLKCECSTGFRGDGFINCEDEDECERGTDVCDENANCVNTLGSYRCRCKPGYSGNGLECGDMNECSSENDCDPDNGICINIDGSYTCTCAPEYTGDGKNCTMVEVACPGQLVGDLCLPDEPPAPNDYPTVPVEYPDEPEPEVEPTASIQYPEAEELNSCVRMTERRPSIVRNSHDYEMLNQKLLAKLIATSNNTRLVYGPFIGLDDRMQPGVLRWRDGKKLEKSDFQAWAPGQPRMVDDRGFGNCVDLVSDPAGSHTESFLWTITLCSKRARYACHTERSDEPAVALCLPLIDIAHGRMSCNDGWRPGSTCSFSCHSGYVLRGPSSRVTCREKNMMWDNEPPVCVRAVCSRPLMPPNSGVMECTNENKEYSVCTFSCKSGYSLHGNETVTCQRNLKWSSQRPCCRDDCPPYARMNLILVLDSSRSISEENFGLIKTFAKKLHRRFEVSQDFTHVSVITHSNQVKLLNNVTVFESSDELDMALDSLPYEGEGTLIGKAINYVTENLAGKRPGTRDVVVVLTDGISHDDVYFPSKNLQDTGAHIISVGVRHAWRYQLHMIASEPTDVNVVEVETYDGLNHIVNIIGEKVCQFSC